MTNSPHCARRLDAPAKSRTSCGTRLALAGMVVLIAGVVPANGQTAAQKEIPGIIFDSDMSSDHDDVGDIAVLHGLASLGECKILGMMVSSRNGGTALCMDAINTYYGKPDIPIGVPPNIGGVGEYAGQIASEFPHALKSAKDCPLAADLYRQILAAQPDQSVTIVTTGFMTNLKALLQSGPDKHSPLNGMDLVRKKVKLFSCAGGAFPKGNEFNFRSSGDDSAYVVVNNWPTRIMYVGFDVGQAVYTAGRLPETPKNNPIRRVYVDIKKQFPYPSWGQIGIYYAVRPNEGLWDAETRGRNHADQAGSNWWSTDQDPTGDQDQGYLLEKVRSPAREGIDALLTLPPNDGKPSRPGQPSNLRATVVGGNKIDLQWTDNAFNETDFIVERRDKGVFAQIATVDANITTYSDAVPPSTANAAYRVKARNAVGDSDYSCVWVYSGWTETILDQTADPGNKPLYTCYQCSNLRWSRGGDFRPDHVALNNDSSHGQDVTINVDVGALGSEGWLYVYFLYQDKDNWYRLSADKASSKFEKRVKGTTSQVGAAGAGMDIGDGSRLKHWQIEVSRAGTLKFICEGTTILNVSEPLALSSGKIGLGGRARTPVWENFNFDTRSSEGSTPAATSK
jgi:hypothetical protein